MRRIAGFTFAVFVTVTLLPPVQAAGDNYLGAHIDYMTPDSERDVDGNGLGGSVLYGFRLHDHFYLETHLSGLVLERGRAGQTDFYQQELGVDAAWRFGSDRGWRPFVLAGVAAIRDDTDVEGQDGVSAGYHAGVGVVTPRLGNSNLRVRLEARYVKDTFLDGMQDLRIGLGVEMPLGGSTSRTERNGSRSDDEDADMDGITDSRDRCPNSLSYVKHDADGCMLANQTIRMYEVSFNNGTSILTAAAREELAPLVRALRGQPGMPVRINGHTDAWGDAEENRRLSEDRAEAVATWLTLQGIPTQRITVKGFGESRPVDTNSTAAGRERNRRIEVVLLEPPSHKE